MPHPSAEPDRQDLRHDRGDEHNLNMSMADEKQKVDYEAERETKHEHAEHKHHYEVSNKASKEYRRYQDHIEPHMRTSQDHTSAPAHTGKGGDYAHEAATRDVHHHHHKDGDNAEECYEETTESYANKHDEHVYFGPGEGKQQGHITAHKGKEMHYAYEDTKAMEEKRELEINVSGDEEVAGDMSPLKSSPSKSLKSTTAKPMLYLTWDGEEDSRQNVEKLKRFLRTKGYIIFEHAGDMSIAEGAPPSPGKDGPPTHDTGNTEGTNASLESARAPVSHEVSEKLKLCTVFVSCVTRKFTFNMNCKKLTLHCRKLVETDRKNAPEMLYVMLHGSFTTESQPYHCRSGWLGYMLRDALWSPAWSHAHIAGAAEAIAGVIALRRNVIKLNPQHVLYIETRGKQGVMPPVKNH